MPLISHLPAGRQGKQPTQSYKKLKKQENALKLFHVEHLTDQKNIKNRNTKIVPRGTIYKNI